MLRKQIYLIAAVSRNGVIGAHGRLPWSLPADRDRFLWLTAGNVIVYGRKTYEHELRRAIPGRLNIVVSSDPNYRLEDALTATSVKHAIQLSQASTLVAACRIIWLAGGERVYSEVCSKHDAFGIVHSWYADGRSKCVWSVPSTVRYLLLIKHAQVLSE
eukprot:1963-Heterococcus_DN1.PRE.1